MKKFSALACLLAVIMLASCARFQKPQTEEDNSSSFRGVFLSGTGKSPFTGGDVLFSSARKDNFFIKDFDEEPVIEKGDSTDGWTEIEDGEKFQSKDKRNIVVAIADDDDEIIEYKLFSFVPGVIYGLSNPDQFDDESAYNSEEPTKEDDRAVRLASNLFKTADETYYGKPYGYISQGYLTVYSSVSGIFDGYYHTGCDITTQNGRPFYSPIDGEIVYAGTNDDYNMVIIYNKEKDVSLLLLHGEDVTPAQMHLEEGTPIAKGDLLGYGGGAGMPAGSTHLHVELDYGSVTRYQNFSKEPSYTRKGTFDPLVIADMFSLEKYETDSFDDFYRLGRDSFGATNNAKALRVGNWEYLADNVQKQLIKCRPDGSEKQILAPCEATNLNLEDGYLYFSNLSDRGYIYKVPVSGGDAEKVLEKDARQYLLYISGSLYFADNSRHGTLSVVDADGKNYKVLLDRNITDLFFDGGTFYYTQDASSKRDRICSYSLSSKSAETLMPMRAVRPFTDSGNLVYSKKYDGLKAYSIPLADVPLGESAAVSINEFAYNQALATYKWYFFTNLSDAESICVQRKGETEYAFISRDVLCTGLTVQGNWLYYSTFASGGEQLVRINLSQISKQVFESGEWKTVTADCDEKAVDVLKIAE